MNALTIPSQPQTDGRPMHVEEGERRVRTTCPPGAGAPATTARYARLPKCLRSRYDSFMSQPGHVELKHEIAIHSAQHEMIMERLEVEDSDEERACALDAVIEIQQDIRTGSTLDTVVKKLEKLRCDLESKDRIRQNLLDAERVSALLAKLKETEVKRMVAANQVLTVTESYNLIMRLASFVEDWFCEAALRQWGWEELRARAIRELYGLLERKNAPSGTGAIRRDNAFAAAKRAEGKTPDTD